MNSVDICRMSALAIAEAIRTKKISPVEIMDVVLRRIEKLNPKVNAFCALGIESSRRQAAEAEKAVTRGDRLGPLHGVPVSIKDLIFTKDFPTTGGSRIYADFIPQQDAIVVQRLKAAGAIIIGKTNTSEFGWTAAMSDNPLFGLTRNPWNPEYNAGGSSGGAAAAVAACMGPLAIGSDAGGSIRVPAETVLTFKLDRPLHVVAAR